PVMDGNEAIKLIREKGYKVPIIVVSAHAMEEDVELSLEAGADGYITKPIDFKNFFETIEEYLKY
ncbi:MAG: response regulator, partial [bacterium]|nr:response regulator [bacterium]